MVSEQVISLVVSDTQRELDLAMVPYDVWGSSVHVRMLERVRIVSPSNAAKILAALKDIKLAAERGDFSIDPGLGAQLTLEREVVKRAGDEAGLSMHTARSRNDQVMITELLFLRDQVLTILEAAMAVVQASYRKARGGIGVPMPGYTHMQPGKPTALSHWYLAHGDALLRTVEAGLELLNRFDMCPLGAVESFGTSWPIDRAFTAQLLGFSRVWEVPQDAISNRGVFQLEMLGLFSQIGLVTSRVAADLMLYSTFEYRMVQFGDAVAERLHPVTGSSVMAQKRNPDAIELLRSTAPQMASLFQAAYGVLSGLPTGYNRDSRETKEYAALGCKKILAALRSLEQVVCSLQFDAVRMRQMVEENYSLTTDVADRLSQLSSVPYRKMYKIVGTAVDLLMEQNRPLSELSLETLREIAKRFGVSLELDQASWREVLSPEAALQRRRHIGAPAPEVAEMICCRRDSKSAEIQGRIAAWRSRIETARSLGQVA